MATPRSRIQKGRSFQKKVMLLLKKAFGLDDDDIRTPVGSENGPDVILCNEKSRQLVGLAIEIKNQQKLSIWEALEQAKRHATNNTTPALVFHRSKQGNTDEWITIPLQHYLSIRCGDGWKKSK